jgi:hypothetical protein
MYKYTRVPPSAKAEAIDGIAGIVIGDVPPPFVFFPLVAPEPPVYKVESKN